jgi:hypothetical protein
MVMHEKMEKNMQRSGYGLIDALSRYFPDRIEENHEKSQSG